jgi:hypothetical protein
MKPSWFHFCSDQTNTTPPVVPIQCGGQQEESEPRAQLRARGGSVEFRRLSNFNARKTGLVCRHLVSCVRATPYPLLSQGNLRSQFLHLFTVEGAWLPFSALWDLSLPCQGSQGLSQIPPQSSLQSPCHQPSAEEGHSGRGEMGHPEPVRFCSSLNSNFIKKPTADPFKAFVEGWGGRRGKAGEVVLGSPLWGSRRSNLHSMESFPFCPGPVCTKGCHNSF